MYHCSKRTEEGSGYSCPSGHFHRLLQCLSAPPVCNGNINTKWHKNTFCCYQWLWLKPINGTFCLSIYPSMSDPGAYPRMHRRHILIGCGQCWNTSLPNFKFLDCWRKPVCSQGEHANSTHAEPWRFESIILPPEINIITKELRNKGKAVRSHCLLTNNRADSRMADRSINVAKYQHPCWGLSGWSSNTKEGFLLTLIYVWSGKMALLCGYG